MAREVAIANNSPVTSAVGKREMRERQRLATKVCFQMRSCRRLGAYVFVHSFGVFC